MSDRKQIMTVTDGDGLILTCCFLDVNTTTCEYNHLMLQTLQEVYGDEFAVPILRTINCRTRKILELIYVKEETG